MLGDPIGIFLPPCQISEKLVKKRTLQLVRTIRRFLVSNRLFPLYIDTYISSQQRYISIHTCINTHDSTALLSSLYL